ncbi:hypothetical protein CBL_00275 [Carabus blaptoides fortunei]
MVLVKETNTSTDSGLLLPMLTQCFYCCRGGGSTYSSSGIAGGSRISPRVSRLYAPSDQPSLTHERRNFKIAPVGVRKECTFARCSPSHLQTELPTVEPRVAASRATPHLLLFPAATLHRSDSRILVSGRRCGRQAWWRRGDLPQTYGGGGCVASPALSANLSLASEDEQWGVAGVCTCGLRCVVLEYNRTFGTYMTGTLYAFFVLWLLGNKSIDSSVFQPRGSDSFTCLLLCTLSSLTPTDGHPSHIHTVFSRGYRPSLKVHYFRPKGGYVASPIEAPPATKPEACNCTELNKERPEMLGR